MFKVLTMLAAERILRDPDTGAVSAIGLLEEVASAKFPLRMPRTGIIAISERSPEDKAELDVTLRIFIGERKLFEHANPVNFQEKLRHRLVLSIAGIPIPEPGRLRMVLDYDGQAEASYSFPIAELTARVTDIQPG